MYQQYTPTSSPSGRGPAGERVCSDLCLLTQLHRLWDCIFLASDIFPGCGWFSDLYKLPGGRAWCLPVDEVGFDPPMGRAMLRCGFGLRRSLRSLYADGWDFVPSLLVVWCEASQHQSPQAVGQGQILVVTSQASCQLSDEYSQISSHIFSLLSPKREPQLSPASLGDSPYQAGRSSQGSLEITAFAVDPRVHEILYASSKCRVSVFPRPLELLHSSPAGLQNQMLWGLLLLMPTPQTRNLT